jgi:LmbE family N-acetylglucosaminyl deacetylase
MTWIYLSPHFDDVIFSCGGLIWEQTLRRERVEIWTVCAGDIPDGEVSPFARSLHTRWQVGAEVIRKRKAEDRAACKVVNATPRYFPIPDCIYRLAPGTPAEFLYPSEETLFGELHPADQGLVTELANDLATALPMEARLVCPLALGNHVDHQLTRQAAEAYGGIYAYYPDYPYAASQEFRPPGDEDWERRVFPLSAEGISAWQSAIAAYSSQISTFWKSKESMLNAVLEYALRQGGVTLWHRLKSES